MEEEVSTVVDSVAEASMVVDLGEAADTGEPRALAPCEQCPGRACPGLFFSTSDEFQPRVNLRQRVWFHRHGFCRRFLRKTICAVGRDFAASW